MVFQFQKNCLKLKTILITSVPQKSLPSAVLYYCITTALGKLFCGTDVRGVPVIHFWIYTLILSTVGIYLLNRLGKVSNLNS